MGGGGGGTFSRYNPHEIATKIRQEEAALDTSVYERELAGKLNGLLASYNDRDAALIKSRLDEIKLFVEEKIDDSLDVMYGGSVAKHTYVDGLSDVDSLLIVTGTDLARRKPDSILDMLATAIKKGIGSRGSVERGSIAVTVTYQDGMEIQLLPALRLGSLLKVPAWKSNSWSSIDPEKFRSGLTKRNEECGGKVIPTIKLAKALIASLPEGVQLTGYHVESLAVSAFRNYTGDKTTVRMLPHFFWQAKDLVLSPMVERTGQSLHVDEYLGPAGGPLRREISHVLDRIARRMRNASAARSVDQWLDLFEG